MKAQPSSPRISDCIVYGILLCILLFELPKAYYLWDPAPGPYRSPSGPFFPEGRPTESSKLSLIAHHITALALFFMVVYHFFGMRTRPREKYEGLTPICLHWAFVGFVLPNVHRLGRFAPTEALFINVAFLSVLSILSLQFMDMSKVTRGHLFVYLIVLCFPVYTVNPRALLAYLLS